LYRFSTEYLLSELTLLRRDLGSTTVVIIAQEPHSKKSVPNLAAAYMISLGIPQNMPPAVAVVPTPPILTVFVPNSSNSGWFWRKQPTIRDAVGRIGQWSGHISATLSTRQ